MGRGDDRWVTCGRLSGRGALGMDADGHKRVWGFVEGRKSHRGHGVIAGFHHTRPDGRGRVARGDRWCESGACGLG